jgi:ketosteroid isomerase-like protein
VNQAERQLREFYAALSNRDLQALQALLAQSPDFEWRVNPTDPDAETLEGGAALHQLEEMLEAFDELSSEIEEVEDLGDRMLLVVHHHARGRASGAVTERREVHVWTFHDGLPVRMEEFATKAEALEA